MHGLPFAWIAAGSAIVDLIAAMACLLVPIPGHGGPRPRVGLGRVVLAVAATGLVFGVKAVGLGAVGANLFGLIHLIYVDLVVLIPALGLGLLVADGLARRRPLDPAEAGRPPVLSRGARAVAVLSLGLPMVGVYATFVEPFRLQVERASVPVGVERAGRGALRVAVMTDLQTRHVTDYERGAVDRLMAERPDLILLPGDVFQGPEEEFEAERPALRALLARLDAPGGVFLAPGDTDQAPGRVARIVEGTRIVPLVNAIARVEVGGRRVSIGGVELNYACDAARRLVRDLEDAPGVEDVRILLAHRPDVVDQLRPSSRVDLVVAGHTHGGQVVVPGFGPIMTLSGVPRAVAAGGLHRVGGHPIYVSRGVGCERGQAPRLRFFCPPEVSILSLGVGP